MILARVAAYAGLCVGIVLVELTLATRVPSRGRRQLATLTDQLMIFSTIVSLGAGLIGSAALGATFIAPAWPVLATGVGLGLTGLILRARAMLALGIDYTLTPRAEPEQVLKSSGPYGLIRHPGYAGILLTILGLQAIAGTWLAVLATLVVIATVPVRIRVEEDMLLERFGPEYVAYQSRTRYRLLPGLY